MKIKDDHLRKIPYQETSIKEVKSLILALAKDCSLDVGHVLPQKPLFTMIVNLNPKQKDAYELALTELVEEGIFESSAGKYLLTPKGKEALY